MKRILSVFLAVVFSISVVGFASAANKEAPAPTPAPTAKPR